MPLSISVWLISSIVVIVARSGSNMWQLRIALNFHLTNKIPKRNEHFFRGKGGDWLVHCADLAALAALAALCWLPELPKSHPLRPPITTILMLNCRWNTSNSIVLLSRLITSRKVFVVHGKSRWSLQTPWQWMSDG